MLRLNCRLSTGNYRFHFIQPEFVNQFFAVLNPIFQNYKDNTIDAFGDAYEFLMSMYASNAGKSGGEFFTPQEVSELLTRLAVVGKREVNKVYDIKTPRLIQFNYSSADFAA